MALLALCVCVSVDGVLQFNLHTIIIKIRFTRAAYGRSVGGVKTIVILATIAYNDDTTSATIGVAVVACAHDNDTRMTPSTWRKL